MALEVIEAPLPGKILKVSVKVGDKVKEGDELCSIEAMKMENPLLSPVNGTVKEVLVTTGIAVKANEKLVSVEY
jgi:biotin carboxyl carrier protein